MLCKQIQTTKFKLPGGAHLDARPIRRRKLLSLSSLLPVLLLVLLGGILLFSRAVVSPGCGTSASESGFQLQPGGGEDYPWVARLIRRRCWWVAIPSCTASIVSPRHLLTAAHCALQKGGFSEMEVVLDGVVVARQRVSAGQIHTHPKYDGNRADYPHSFAYDIAVVELAEPLQLLDSNTSSTHDHLNRQTQQLQAIRLEDIDWEKMGTMAYAGWGYFLATSIRSSRVKQGRMRLNQVKCLVPMSSFTCSPLFRRYISR